MIRILCILAAAGCATVAAAAEPPTFSKGRGFDERSGAALYRSICQGCHQPDGQGAHGAGVYPPLALDANLTSPRYVIAVLLRGRKNMPPFASSLDDEQIAAVATYVRTHFGNEYRDAIAATEVAGLRASK